MQKYTSLFLITAIFAASFFVTIPTALASIQILPLRAQLDDKNRSVDLIVRNTTNETNTYWLRWNDHFINDDGIIKAKGVDVTSEDENPYKVSKIVRVAPRQIIIPPGESQIVRLSLRRPKSLPEGEYYSHLAFITKPETVNEDSILRRETVKKSSPTLKIVPNLAFNIPVFVRHGEGEVGAIIEDIKFLTPRPGAPKLDLSLKLKVPETASSSPFGRINAIWSYNGEDKNIGFIRNAYSYPNAPARNFQMSLDAKSLPGGKLTLQYIGEHEYEGLLLDEKIIQLSQ